MASVNKAILIGHLGRDPETRQTTAGNAVVSFSLATGESWRDKTTGERRDRTQWHNVVIFNEPLGKIAAEFLRKGSKVYVEGEIETRKFTDKTGLERTTTEIILRQFRGALTLLDRAEKPPAPDPDSYGETRTREPRRNPDDPRAPAEPPRPIDDDIPF